MIFRLRLSVGKGISEREEQVQKPGGRTKRLSFIRVKCNGRSFRHETRLAGRKLSSCTLEKIESKAKP